jgi:hypothetical protein
LTPAKPAVKDGADPKVCIAHGGRKRSGEPVARHPFTIERTATMRITRNIGMLLLAILLIAWGLAQLLGIGGIGVILAILAIAAGIFILLGR